MWLWSKPGLIQTWSKPGITLVRGLHVGQVFSLTKSFSQRDVELFAVLTGDTNPLHLDAVYSRSTAFSRPVVHGVLVNGLVSALLGCSAPGCVLVKQQIRFPAPLFPDEVVLTRAEVQRIRLSTALIAVSCRVQERVVLEGTVTVRIHPGLQED